MLISHIYDQYHIPINLQKHMLRVAAVGKIISENIMDVSVDAKLIIETLLLHDMGNLLKFDFNNTDIFADEDKNKIDFYKEKQLQFKKKYGSNPDDATLSIIQEITPDNKITELCQQTHSESLDIFLHTPNWNHKICYYSDMRIGLKGILSVDERFEDLIRRYPDRSEMPIWHKQCKIIETQLQEKVTTDLQSITNQQLEAQFDHLKKVEI